MGSILPGRIEVSRDQGMLASGLKAIENSTNLVVAEDEITTPFCTDKAPKAVEP
jgi:hypothetical protein